MAHRDTLLAGTLNSRGNKLTNIHENYVLTNISDLTVFYTLFLSLPELFLFETFTLKVIIGIVTCP